MCDCNQTKAFIGNDLPTASLGKAKISLNQLEDVGEVRGNLNELESSLIHLDMAIGELTKKISPVLNTMKAVPEKPSNGQPTAPSACEVGHRIRQSIDQVYRLQNVLNRIREDVSL